MKAIQLVIPEVRMEADDATEFKPGPHAVEAAVRSHRAKGGGERVFFNVPAIVQVVEEVLAGRTDFCCNQVRADLGLLPRVRVPSRPRYGDGSLKGRASRGSGA